MTDARYRRRPEPVVRFSRLEREVMAALERHNWIQSRAARELGLTLRQMGYRIKKFGLERLVNERKGREPGLEME